MHQGILDSKGVPKQILKSEMRNTQKDETGGEREIKNMPPLG